MKWAIDYRNMCNEIHGLFCFPNKAYAILAMKMLDNKCKVNGHEYHYNGFADMALNNLKCTHYEEIDYHNIVNGIITLDEEEYIIFNEYPIDLYDF